MAVFESGERRVTHILTFFRCILPLLVANCHSVDSIFLWTAPPPAWNQTVPGTNAAANLQTAVIPVLNGSTNYHVRWNYTLLDGQSISFTTFSIVDGSSVQDIGFIFNPGTPTESTTITSGDDFQTRFGLQSNSEFSTLTINTVTERENITFWCKLQVGSDQWAYNIRTEVTVPPDVTHISDNQTVIQNDNMTLNCTADGHPPPSITWTRLSDNSVVTFPLTIKKQDQGGYRCTANNSIGSPATNDVFITVLYNPDNVTLVTNTTENKDCSVLMVVNFACVASEANPAVTNYQLLESGGDTSVSNSGMWIKEISKGGKHVYSCLAEHPMGNKSSANVTLTKNVPAEIPVYLVKGNEAVEEGGDLLLYCKGTGFPDPTITWTKDGVDDPVARTPWLNFTNINRDKAGNYTCHVNNTCGNASVMTSIDVQYNPDNVTLVTNTTENKDCSGLMMVNFTCVASEANPEVTNYQLYGSGGVLRVSNSGMWIKEITGEGKHGYSCLAEHPVGNKSSANVILTKNVPAEISVNLVKGNETLEEGGDLSLYCKGTGFPDPTITWTKDGVDVSSSWLNFTNINRDKAGNYTCHANNTCGNASVMTRIDVQYPPNITYVYGNETVNDTDTVSLLCIADGNPPPSITWTKNNNVVPKRFDINGRDSGGNYTCTADNSIGSSDSKDIFITVENYRPTNPSSLTTNVSDDTVVVGTSLTLNCSAQAKPPAKYRFYRGPESLFNTTAGSNFAEYTTPVNKRDTPVIYRCIPFNEYGDGPPQTVSVTVQHKPENVTLSPPSCAFNGREVTFNCTARANPPVHTYRLYENGDTIVNMSGSGLWMRTLTTNGQFDYRCEANNSVGTGKSDNITLTVQVVVKTMEIKLNVSNIRCTNFSKENFTETVIRILGPEGLVCPEIQKCESGSAIIYLVLRFSQSVNDTYVIDVLIKAVQEGKFGNFVVDPASIKLTSQSSTASPLPTGTGTRGTQVPVCEETFLRNADCSTIVWKIVVLAVAGVVLIVIVVGIIAWWVHKRRKCRKDSRIHNSEERLHGNAEDNAYPQVNHGYAGTGPRPNGTEAVALQQRAAADGSVAAAHQQEAAAIPTYAEVDKSKKKKKAEEKLDYTYAEVDKSKKSKKKPKPGEMIYADLEDINVPRPMPTVSTSPQPLPPIKRPEPYENTQYADITQFLKGDATLPQSDSNQGTELQPQGANKDEDGAGGEDRNTPISRQDVQFGIEGNSDAQVNNKYAESGPAPSSVTEGAGRQQRPDANGHKAAANQQAAAAPPTYAAVDKSKKKSKRKKEEEKSPGNSVVDKSQTKKQSDDTYAQVDKSKKSIKKQPNPEGVIYADLEGINMPRMPQVSTSPQPLPPLKRPTPYEGTEYADITEFRKGDTSPKTDDCADPEMQAQGTNKDGIGENNNETSF